MQALFLETAVGVFAAGAELVDIVLGDGGDDHAGAGDDETSSDTLQWGEVESHAAETGVDEAVEDGDEDDQGEGVEVVNDIVGHTIEFHGCGLGGEVVQHLVVGQP